MAALSTSRDPASASLTPTTNASPKANGATMRLAGDIMKGKKQNENNN
jgi:hypothetical protein